MLLLKEQSSFVLQCGAAIVKKLNHRTMVYIWKPWCCRGLKVTVVVFRYALNPFRGLTSIYRLSLTLLYQMPPWLSSFHYQCPIKKLSVWVKQFWLELERTVISMLIHKPKAAKGLLIVSSTFSIQGSGQAEFSVCSLETINGCW